MFHVFNLNSLCSKTHKQKIKNCCASKQTGTCKKSSNEVVDLCVTYAVNVPLLFDDNNDRKSLDKNIAKETLKPIPKEFCSSDGITHLARI